VKLQVFAISILADKRTADRPTRRRSYKTFCRRRRGGKISKSVCPHQVFSSLVQYLRERPGAYPRGEQLKGHSVIFEAKKFYQFEPSKVFML
jgi:hypothetical protein